MKMLNKLAYVLLAVDELEGRTTLEIEKKVSITPSLVYSYMIKLEKAGLVRRGVAGSGKPVYLTEKGKSVAECLRELRRLGIE